MADVGPAEIGNTRTRAPFGGYPGLVAAELRVVRHDRIAPPAPDPGDTADRWIAGDVEQRPVHSVELFVTLLLHHHMAGKILLQRLAALLAEDRDVSCVYSKSVVFGMSVSG